MFIALEGVNAAGKSSVLEALRGRQGVEVWEGPRLQIDSARATVLEAGAPLARFFYFLALNQQVAFEVASLRDRVSCVCSRYLYSSVAYHAAREAVDQHAALRELLRYARELPLPDLVVQLDVSREAQAERRSERAAHGPQRYGVDDTVFPAFDNRMRAVYAWFRAESDVPWHVVDTSDISPAAAADRVLSWL